MDCETEGRTDMGETCREGEPVAQPQGRPEPRGTQDPASAAPRLPAASGQGQHREGH